MLNLNQDLQFLVHCCQTHLTDEDKEFILSYLDTEDLEPNTLIQLANQHGILPLVYKTLKELLQEESPDSSHNTLLSTLKMSYMQIAQRNIMMSAELLKIMQLLEKNHIEALAFKGPALSQIAYGDITLRQYSDLDILIKQKDAYKASQLLSNYNYQSTIDLKYLRNSALLDLSKDVDLYNRNNNILVELHWSLFENNLSLNSIDTYFWDNAIHIKINNSDIKTLTTDLLLLYLCIHGSKHMWERIEWIADIDRIIRAQKILDWEQIIKSANELNSMNMLLLALSLSSKLFDTKLPENIKIEINNNSAVQELIVETKKFLNYNGLNI